MNRRVVTAQGLLGQPRDLLTPFWLLLGGLLFAFHSFAADVPASTPVHWSLKPVTRPPVPAAPNPKWRSRNPIDNFVFAKLAEAKLSPSPEAPRRSLIRRLYFDLIGLPPSPVEVRAFERDSAPDAYEKLVDRLLSSPHYGERWARHWLDVVRFAETHGFEMNQPRPTAWRYRDYVIDAFNQDKPYNRFIVEQFAGDVLGQDAATGFLVGGPWDQVKSPDPVLTAAQRADELHDMVSTTGSVFLGLTVGCARCHNHKFDPIPQTDYYAIKACLAGVEHGERKLNTPESAEHAQAAERSRKQLVEVEAALEQFEPVASAGRILLVEPEPSFGSRLVQQLKDATRVSYAAGNGRGEREDPGGLDRLANPSHAYLAWSNAANTDVFVCEPGLEGRFHVWLSWGCGFDSYAKDAVFLLDPDGDLTTTNDQTQLARIDQRHSVNETGELPNKAVWSGFFDAGIWQLSGSNKVLLRGGATEATTTAGMIAFVEEPAGTSVATTLRSTTGTALNPSKAAHFLRSSVSAKRNVERFAPTEARRLRLTIQRTTDAEPCIDELEVYSAEAHVRNLALASEGTKPSASSVFPNSDLHRLEHLNDGKVGNSHSWISNERGKGWVELEFPGLVTINRVVWSRDREQQFSDRLALEYRIEVASSSNDWRLVASSQDRVPYLAGRAAVPDYNIGGLSDEQGTQLKRLLVQQEELEKQVKDLTSVPMVYAGTFTPAPAPMHRLQRGDPMQERETVEPGVLSAIPVKFKLDEVTAPADSEAHASSRSVEAASTIRVALKESSALTTAQATSITVDQQRRLALAQWIADPANPLPARVMVNRLWQHHFGEGLVSTPSDFGKNGARPTHPELLDWLAAEFMHPTVPEGLKSRQGTPAQAWSLKHIQRLIVTSATYRQASASRSEAAQVDAASRLLWRFPPQRLEAEPLRDTILAVSGKLDLSMGGPGFSVFEPNDNYVRVYNPRKEWGPAEWRRMIYMTKVRMQQDATFGAFDCPDGGQIAPKRMHSTTPLQALNLLNSEFMMQQASFLAERLEREAGKNPKAQIQRAFELAYSRRPEKQETRMAEAFIAQQGLPLFCRALLNSNEFLFVD